MSQYLSVQFGSILQTPTLFPNELGQIEVTVTNFSTEAVSETSLNLYASTDAELDNLVLNTIDDRLEGTDISALKGTDELLGTLSNISLGAGESKTLIIDFAAEDFQTASVVSPGAYNLIAEIDPDNTIGEREETNNQGVQFISGDGTDAVIDWNSVFLNIAQAEGKADMINGVSLSDSEIPGLAPPIQAHDGAILNLAIYDAVNAISGGNQAYLAGLNAPSDALAEAAATGAAYTVLSELYPEYRATIGEQLLRSLNEFQDSPVSAFRGFNFGTEVAQKILELRADDGVEQAQGAYEAGNSPGEYQENVTLNPEKGELLGSVSLLPNYGEVTPFALNNLEDFRPDGPPEYGSDEYLAELEQVAQFGGRFDTATTDVIRTQEQTEIAEFWTLDRIDTFRPTGHLYEIAQSVALQQGNTLEENALLFAQLSTALADTAIVTWDAKYTYQQARPITSVDELLDPEWQPLLNTPPFPDYIAGHAAFGGAAARVLENSFGEDLTFEVTSQELPGVTRVFSSVGDVSSFEQLALEDANSRLYGGVHVSSSNLEAVDVGVEVANYVIDNFFDSTESFV